MSNKEIARMPLEVADHEIVLSCHQFKSKNLAAESGVDMERFGRNTPGVYCFYDADQIYIGESVHPFMRLKQHSIGVDARLDDNKDIMVYSSPQLSKSSIYHVEGELIQMATAYKAELDVNWRNILNANRELPPRYNGGRYFLKDQYDGVAERIGQQGLEYSLVNADAATVFKTSHYVISPYKNLNTGQAEAMGDLLSKGSQYKMIVVNGFPGTGKSVLAATLFNKLLESKSVALTSGTKPTLDAFLKMFKYSVKGTRSSVVKVRELLTDKTLPFAYDLVIVDEGHRLLRRSAKGHPGKVMHIESSIDGKEGDELSMLTAKFKHVVVFYDSHQNVHDGDFDAEQVFNRLEVYKLNLSEQERLSDAAAGYVTRLFAFFSGGEVTGLYDGKYLIEQYDRFGGLVSALKQKAGSSLGKHAALLSGYTREWKTERIKKGPELMKACDFVLDGVPLRWNTSFSGGFLSKPARKLEEVAYYRIVQGMETDFTGVIIGKDLRGDTVKKRLFADEKYVMNANERPNFSVMLKAGKTREDYNEKLLQLVINRYKILLTRALEGVFVYVEDEPLRAKFKELFATAPLNNF